MLFLIFWPDIYCKNIIASLIQDKIYLFPDSSAGKESATIQETTVQFLGQEVPLEKG